MENIFITKIHIGKVRHLENVDIEISETQRKHLIITGKNGSGKTSLLEAMMRKILIEQYDRSHEEKDDYDFWSQHYDILKEKGIPNINISYSEQNANLYHTVFSYISIWRSKLIVPTAIEKTEIKGKTAMLRNASKEFLKYMLNLDYQLYGAKMENNAEVEKNLEQWLNNFHIALREIYNCQKLELKRDTKKLIFKIEMPGREPFGLHEMADGYSAFLDIVMELLLRFVDDDAVVDYKMPAIVMIDEIETHLHVELQKRVLPFLTQMFPNVQFIVATHSAFVIQSISNAVVFDLENKRRVEDLSAYSWETIVESYFETGQYSHIITEKFNKYRELYHKERSHDEEKDFFRIRMELKKVSPAQKELYNAFRQMELDLTGKAAK